MLKMGLNNRIVNIIMIILLLLTIFRLIKGVAIVIMILEIAIQIISIYNSKTYHLANLQKSTPITNKYIIKENMYILSKEF
jgi:hypothetical protein